MAANRPFRPAVITHARRAVAALFAVAMAIQSPLAAADLAVSQSGLDLPHIDRSIDPGTDFYRFANGRWHDSYVFKDDEIYAGARANLIALRKARIRAIIEAARATPGRSGVEAIVGPFYASFLEEAQIERVGLRPAAADLSRIRAMRTMRDVLDLFADGPRTGLPSAFQGSIFYDFHEPGRLRYMIAPGGFSLPQREQYSDGSAEAVALRDAYKVYLADMLRMVGERDPDEKAQAVLDLEAALAARTWASRDARDPLKTANPLSVAELKALAPPIDWDRYLVRAGVAGVDRIIVAQPDQMQAFSRLVTQTPVDTWRSWALVHYLNINAPYLAKRFADRRFDFFQRRLAGQQEPAPRWQRGVELVESYFGDALGQLYVERYFPEKSRDIVAAMFDNIRAVMRAKIVGASWMEPSTKAEALRKIDTLNVKIGYPSKWQSYGAIAFDRAHLFENIKKARARAWTQNARLIYEPLPRDRWMTTAQTSSAAANPGMNEITIPAGALEPPYFSPAADSAVNYGAIGAIIGHELSHLFDQFGRKMDATGKLRDWWAPADAARYEDVAARVVAQYDGLELAQGMAVNGRVTMNENIADIAGLDIAHAAWRRSLAGKAAPVLDGFTGDQRFFLAWSQMRAGKMTDAMQRGQLASGPHAPDLIRGTQPLRNIDAWYDAFAVGPRDPLYIAPAKRAKFW